MHLKSLKSVYGGMQTVTMSEATTRKAVSAGKVDTGWVVLVTDRSYAEDRQGKTM